MTQPNCPSDDLPTKGTIPLGPDEPELFTDAMCRILRHLDTDYPTHSNPSKPSPYATRPPRGGSSRDSHQAYKEYSE
ncbi:MAG: hypothetical protein QG622_404 [Actinomycetota bacterium]|nr:hypothetical protein [Actinomycetota bacterium]